MMDRSIKHLLTILIFTFFFHSCKRAISEGELIFTLISPSGISEIAAIDPTDPDEEILYLSKEFYSAKSPVISCDSKLMLFTAKKMESDTWQVWIMYLENYSVIQITDFPEDAFDPAFLPSGRIVFSRNNSSGSQSVMLFTCNTDGSDLQQITFDPEEYSKSSILADGRIISVNRRLFPDTGQEVLMTMRPDGTKSELFYDPDDDLVISGDLTETNDGKIVFIVNDTSNNKSGLFSVSYNNPFHSKTSITPGMEGEFRSLYCKTDGKFLISYRPPAAPNFGIFEYDPVSGALNEHFLNERSDAINPVRVEKRHRQKKLPSEVDMGARTGLLFCQDINFSGNGLSDGSLSKATSISIQGIDSSLGRITAESDGSLYLRIIADTPFRIQTVDSTGKVLNTCEWMYLRPNERRGCVGCHEDHNIVPANIVPLSVRKPPVNVPVDIHEIKEKVIMLE